VPWCASCVRFRPVSRLCSCPSFWVSCVVAASTSSAD
jgi:hypothetical protein